MKRSLRAGVFAAAVVLLACSAQLSVFAGGPPGIVPEIDGNSISAGLACLAGGVLMVRARLRK
jgi:hypothetical protein